MKNELEMVKTLFRVNENVKAMEYAEEKGITDEELETVFNEYLEELKVKNEEVQEKSEIELKAEAMKNELEEIMDTDIYYTILVGDENGALVKFEEDNSRYVVYLDMGQMNEKEVFEGTTKLSDHDEDDDEEYNRKTIKTWKGARNYAVRFLSKRV